VSREAATTATLLITARESLEKFVDVRVDDDGALSFRHGDVPCAVQGIELVEGLAVLSLTCVVAWDLTGDEVPGHRRRLGRDPALRLPRGGSGRGPARHAAHAGRLDRLPGARGARRRQLIAPESSPFVRFIP
jgi:hypothetical protein